MRRIIRQRQLFIMLLPAFLLVLMFSYMPLVGWFMAFTRYQVGKSIFDAPWAGLDHFKMFFLQGNDYVYLLRNTLAMNLMNLIIGIFLAMLFAILLNEVKIKAVSKLVQSASFFPFFLSWIIVYSIAYAFFAQGGGAVTTLLQSVGLLPARANLLGESRYAWSMAIGLQLWKSLGYNSVIFLSAISAIPQEQYESAIVDGATRFQRMFYITIPNLLTTVMVLLILNSGWILNSNFDFYWIFTNPTNWERMEVLDMYIYKFGLRQLNFSYATAIGMVKSLVSILLILGVNTVSRRTTDRAIF